MFLYEQRVSYNLTKQITEGQKQKVDNKITSGLILAVLLLIPKKGGGMLLTRKNPKGGRRLSIFPIETEKRSGRMGYKFGYCDGCGEELIAVFSDANEIGKEFANSILAFNEKVLELNKPHVVKESLRMRFVKWFIKDQEEFKEISERLADQKVYD